MYKVCFALLLTLGICGCNQKDEVKEMHFGPGPGDESYDCGNVDA